MSAKVIPALSAPSELVIRFKHHPDCGEGAEFPWDCTCDWEGAYERVRNAMALDAAWQEAEAALPPGWGFAVAFTNRYRADAWHATTDRKVTTDGSTPAAALLALAEKLRAAK